MVHNDDDDEDGDIDGEKEEDSSSPDALAREIAALAIQATSAGTSLRICVV